MNMHGDRLRLDHQPVASSEAGLSPLWAEAKTEHASSCATKLQQGSFAPPELPGFHATMNPSDSRTWPKHGYLFPWSVVAASQPRHRAGSPRFLSGSVATRRPLSPREVRPLCLLVIPRPVIGFTRFGGLATPKFVSRGRNRFTFVTADSFVFRGFRPTGRPVACPIDYMANKQFP
jgi:hypothetical protein